MICRNCGRELPDLAMYCPSCGTKQFGSTESEKEELTLELNDPMISRVIIEKIDNQTSAMAALKKVTGLEIAEIRKILSGLPYEIGSFMSAEAAEKLEAELNEAGITARTGKIGDEEEILQLRSREVK